MQDLIFYLSSGLFFGIIAGISPGPLLPLVVSETLKFGPKEGIKLSLAPLITDIPIVLASFFIISNVIKLNVFARKDEIEILRLVGATNIFIRVPFLLEGITLGVIGGMVSLFLLFLLINSIPIYLGSRLGVLNELINFRYLSFSQSITIIAEGGVIGFLGSITSLTRFLKT